ncbi:MAG: bifunctional 5,10-methylenetetrahydrofolate dehydrogenase/5,10-methenyltetrahydrofolate cyclohydrolase [Clostridium sp.]
MTRIVKGMDIANKIGENLADDVTELANRGITPTLAILRVGAKQSDVAYERGAIKRCQKVGVAVKSVVLPEQVTQDDMIRQIKQLNTDIQVHGILIMRPLPESIDDEVVRSTLLPEKDVDGITYESMIGSYAGIERGFAPCTAQACMEVLKYFHIDVKGKHITVVGSSLVVGRPVAMMLLNAFATVDICNVFTDDVPAECRMADIIIAAAGCPNLIGRECVKEGQIVLDVGINIDAQGKIRGDVDEEAVNGIVEWLTAVPGGIGTVTTAVLAEHVIRAAMS